MQRIKIDALDNGAHRNQTYDGFLPEGWAIILVETNTLENFPFGSFETYESNGLTYMDPTTWVPGEIPEPEEPTEPETGETDLTVWDELDAAYQEGVDSV